MAYGFDSFFSGMMEFTKNAADRANGDFDTELLFDLFANIGLYGFAILVFSLGYLCAMIGITKISYSVANGERISIGEAFNKIFSVTLLRSIGQALLLSLVVFACLSAGIILIAVGAGTEAIPLIIVGVLALMAGVVLMLYLIFRWYFAFVAIVCEDKKVIESFSKSSMLVEGNWWRTFGIVLLFSVIIDFAISIISTPIYFIAMWDFFSQYLKMMAEGNFNENNPEVIFNMMESFGFAFGVVIILSTVLDALVTPLFNVVYYFDLKIRKKDFPELIVSENSIGGVPPIE
jgi:hypothetical protein